MKCQKAQIKVIPFLNGELAEAEAQKIHLHLEACSRCAREAEVLSKSWNLLLDLPEPHQIPNLVPQTLDYIQKMQEETFAKKIWAWIMRIQNPLTAATALAVGLILGVFIGKSLFTNYSLGPPTEDSLYLETFEDLPPNSIADVYMTLNFNKGDESL
jgi:hypothetical protein